MEATMSLGIRNAVHSSHLVCEKQIHVENRLSKPLLHRPVDGVCKVVMKRHSSLFGCRLYEHEAYSRVSLRRSLCLDVYAAKRVQNDKCFALSSTLVVEEGNEEKAMQLCNDIVSWASEKQKNRSSGIVQFQCNADIYEKNVFHFWEIYNSFGNMNSTRSTDEHTEFTNKVRPLLTGPIKMACYEYTNGQIGHMLNPIGPKGEGGLDDATGQGGQKQQSAAIDLGSVEREAWGMDKMLNKKNTTAPAAKETKPNEESAWSLKNIVKSLTRN